ncbi:MAG: hypothetical protein WAW39_19665, partial [Prosthecobacter sp.]|uniref:hypothetical protein n=1 Tax=Prosthecobacter sp. TaxID=1965333 RepID=UPI003BB1276D
FTWMFEAFAVAVLQSAASTQEACALLDIGWEAAQRLMERAVAGSGLWTDAISPEVLFVRILEHF